MNNTVALNPEGYIEIALIGEQTSATFEDTYNAVVPLIDQLQQDGKPLLALIDGSRQTGFSIGSDKAALKFLEQIDYQKIAMYAISHAEVTKGIILAMGKSHNTKLFPDRTRALEWLMAQPNL